MSATMIVVLDPTWTSRQGITIQACAIPSCQMTHLHFHHDSRSTW